ncbi:MAG: hydroxymethylbilane synthase [Bdellovibrionales bacterium]|nr:hydroxymethylbilane synthase [Bdellovibrionales bacterium]
MNFRLGTRGSALALAQTDIFVQEFLRKHPGTTVEVCQITTTGDLGQGMPRRVNADKKDWIHELELALISGEIDFALHSGKDVPCDIHPETTLIPVLEREDPRDLFIGKLVDGGGRLSFYDLHHGAAIGTGSLRRKAQLKQLRKDLRVTDFRGNVPTRIRKLDEDSSIDGIVIAAAGVQRLSGCGVSGVPFSVTEVLPAVNQGILVVQVRGDNVPLIEKVQLLSSEALQCVFHAERAVIEVLEGDCRSAIGAFAELSGEGLEVFGKVCSQDGDIALSASAKGAIDHARSLGIKVGQELLGQGADRLLRAV